MALQTLLNVFLHLILLNPIRKSKKYPKSLPRYPFLGFVTLEGNLEPKQKGTPLGYQGYGLDMKPHEELSGRPGRPNTAD